MTIETFNKYRQNGFQMIRLNHEKKPLKKRYDENGNIIKTSDQFKEDANYAIVPPSSILIIDVDVKNGKKGLESLAKLESDLLETFVPSVRTGSGGLHIYVKTSVPVRITQKDYPDIDFIGYKANNRLCTPYAVAGDQTIIVNDKNYVYELLENGIFINDVSGLSDVLEIDEMSLENDDTFTVDDLYEKKTPEEIKQLLKWLDASDYIEWMANASAIKRELGNTKEAFDIFHNWSKTAPNYSDRDDCLRKWKNVGEYQGKPRTMATLYLNAMTNKTNKLLNEINTCNEDYELEDIVKKEIWIEYPKFTQTIISNEISKSYQSKSNKLGSSITYNDSQKVVKVLYGKELSEIEQTDLEDEDTELFEDFVRVTSFKSAPYYQISNNARHDLEGAGRVLSSALTKISKKLRLKKTMSVQEAFKRGFINYAVSHSYNPLTNKRLFKDDKGANVLNLFDHYTVPKETPYTKEGKKLIDRFIKHLRYIMEPEEAEIFLDWMAYAAQNIGKKILWVPLIQSVEGIGKSVIGNLLINHVFGHHNSGIVDSVIVADKNNSWASSKVLRVLEEIKLSGHNRYEVLNQLKPLITNPLVTRVEKFEVSTEMPNTCNFIAFTNYKDALPVDEHDRRWWIVFSPLTSMKDLEAKAGEPKEKYFVHLHDLANEESPYGTEFKTYLLNRDVSKFNPKFPPESNHKEELAEIERSKINGVDEVQDLIKAVYKIDQPRVINFKLIREANEFALNEQGKRLVVKILNPKEVRHILKQLGYKVINKREYQNADWTGVSPCFYHSATTTVVEAIKIWEKKFTIDFVAEQFEDLEDVL